MPRGFNPKPRVQFGPALAVGIESVAEVLEMELTAPLDTVVALSAINASLPSGLKAIALEAAAAAGPGLAESIRAARYLVKVPEGVDASRASSLFADREGVTVRREKNGKEMSFPLAAWLLDVRPVDERAFRMTLGLGGDGASVRPDEVLRAMFGEEGRSATLLREELGAARAERAPG